MGTSRCCESKRLVLWSVLVCSLVDGVVAWPVACGGTRVAWPRRGHSRNPAGGLLQTRTGMGLLWLCLRISRRWNAGSKTQWGVLGDRQQRPTGRLGDEGLGAAVRRGSVEPMPCRTRGNVGVVDRGAGSMVVFPWRRRWTFCGASFSSPPSPGAALLLLLPSSPLLCSLSALFCRCGGGGRKELGALGLVAATGFYRGSARV